MRTIDIPGPGGHTANLTDDPIEVTPRKRREVEIYSSLIGRSLPDIINAKRLLVDGSVVSDNENMAVGPDVHLTMTEVRKLRDLNDVSAWALLDSWTLDLPLPRNVDEFLDNTPANAYAAIVAHAAVILAEGMLQGGFTADEALPEPNADGSMPDPDVTLPTSG